jgi:hypothetical protein
MTKSSLVTVSITDNIDGRHCTKTVTLLGSAVMESLADGGKRFIVYVDDNSPIEVSSDYDDLLHGGQYGE